MFKRKAILKYETDISIVPDIITPAKNNIPEWYKKIPTIKDEDRFSFENGFAQSVKWCMPFFDTFTTGYTVNLAFDLFVTLTKDGDPFLSWKVPDEYAPSWRDRPADPNLVPLGHFDTEYTWKFNCSFVVPKNYSILVTHPLNRNDLPFTTVSGIIDGGFVTIPQGNVPFYIKKGFTGIIAKGTPIAQLIPFSNEFWKSQIENGLTKEGLDNNNRGNTILFGFYKKTFWKRKKYE
jgi:hypothetical protein